jgi:hypothetical protein
VGQIPIRWICRTNRARRSQVAGAAVKNQTVLAVAEGAAYWRWTTHSDVMRATAFVSLVAPFSARTGGGFVEFSEGLRWIGLRYVVLLQYIGEKEATSCEVAGDCIE